MGSQSSSGRTWTWGLLQLLCQRHPQQQAADMEVETASCGKREVLPTEVLQRWDGHHQNQKATRRPPRPPAQQVEWTQYDEDESFELVSDVADEERLPQPERQLHQEGQQGAMAMPPPGPPGGDGDDPGRDRRERRATERDHRPDPPAEDDDNDEEHPRSTDTTLSFKRQRMASQSSARSPEYWLRGRGKGSKQNVDTGEEGATIVHGALSPNLAWQTMYSKGLRPRQLFTHDQGKEQWPIHPSADRQRQLARRTKAQCPDSLCHGAGQSGSTDSRPCERDQCGPATSSSSGAGCCKGSQLCDCRPNWGGKWSCPSSSWEGEWKVPSLSDANGQGHPSHSRRTPGPLCSKRESQKQRGNREQQ